MSCSRHRAITQPSANLESRVVPRRSISARWRLQEELEALFIQLDKAKGRATSSLGKSELGDALRVFFRVGQPGGKTEERYDELMQVASLLPVLSLGHNCIYMKWEIKLNCVIDGK